MFVAPFRWSTKFFAVSSSEVLFSISDSRFSVIESKIQFRMGQFITRYDAFLEGDRGAA